jgi:putative salt-induced outer membrane protein YdiY
MFRRVCVLVSLISLAIPVTAAAQEQTPPANEWRYNVGGGLSLTSGNKDTSTYNASYDVTFQAGENHTFKSDALLLRGTTSGELSHDRFGLRLREERRINDRVFVFGQNQYARDRFKRIQYLVAPTGGVGFTAASSDATELSFDVGAGGVWEKNPYQDVRASGALTFSQKLRQAVSTTTVMTQSVSALWKTEDLSDAIYELGVGLAVGLNSHLQLKIEALNTYNTRPTGTAVRKNDISTVFAVALKN